MITENQKRNEPVEITLLVCTFNRSEDLGELLETALVQETKGEFAYEVLVVDNNSCDNTREVVQCFIDAGHKNLRYIFEAKQGKSNALNTGLDSAQGHFYAIVDDDFMLPANWVRELVKGLRSHSEVSVISGKVLPLWQVKPPAWLSKDHWSAIAMADYGDKEFYVDENNQICLLACSFRTADVKAVGAYKSDLGVTKNQIGGTEDLEILQRLWKSGRKGIYLPHIWFHHKVTPDRCTKTYHRRWHTEHGIFYATMRDEDFEQSAARLFDVPAHMYRQAAVNAGNWAKCLLVGNTDKAFGHEIELRFFAGFFRKRLSDFRASGSRAAPSELVSFIRSLLKRPRT